MQRSFTLAFVAEGASEFDLLRDFNSFGFFFDLNRATLFVDHDLTEARRVS
jgi:hypothetical protein